MNIPKYIPLLELIQTGDIPQEVQRTLPSCVINALSEIAYNLVYGYVSLDDSEIAKLKTVKPQLIVLCDRHARLGKKRKLVNAELLTIILPSVKRYLQNGREDRN